MKNFDKPQQLVSQIRTDVEQLKLGILSAVSRAARARLEEIGDVDADSGPDRISYSISGKAEPTEYLNKSLQFHRVVDSLIDDIDEILGRKRLL